MYTNYAILNQSTNHILTNSDVMRVNIYGLGSAPVTVSAAPPVSGAGDIIYKRVMGGKKIVVSGQIYADGDVPYNILKRNLYEGFALQTVPTYFRISTYMPMSAQSWVIYGVVSDFDMFQESVGSPFTCKFSFEIQSPFPYLFTGIHVAAGVAVNAQSSPGGVPIPFGVSMPMGGQPVLAIVNNYYNPSIAPIRIAAIQVSGNFQRFTLTNLDNDTFIDISLPNYMSQAGIYGTDFGNFLTDVPYVNVKGSLLLDRSVNNLSARTVGSCSYQILYYKPAEYYV